MPVSILMVHYHKVVTNAVKEESGPSGSRGIFTSARIIRYAISRDHIEDARCANTAACLSVEDLRLDAISTLVQVEDRMVVAC